MELYLQFGHGMMEHSRHLIGNWHGGKVILSPRDLSEQQLQDVSRDLADVKGRTLLDPQFYNPRADHHGLVRHNYWPNDFDTAAFLAGAPLGALLGELVRLNDMANTEAFILPGLFCARVDDDWINVQEAIIKAAARINGRPRIATICMSAEALRFDEQIEVLLNSAGGWNVDGYYIVAEHPAGQYLVDDPVWLANLLILCSGLKIRRKPVIVGYASHQMLALAAAKVDAIASGTHLNVRSFSTTKFEEPEPGKESRKAKWYYCPQSLSEYKLPFLDMAFQRGTLPMFRPPAALGSHYADVLFSGAQPTSTAFSETEAHRHYLTCLHHQCHTAGRPSFRDTVSAHLALLDAARTVIHSAHQSGVRGQNRDFEDIIDVNRSALEALVDSRGFVLDRQWA